ncbi:MAG: hypothetical protein GEV07_01760 [Streptosporangiales bacterium]|nr:hypothetical protein [Streptosporangiales bacterium]
MAGDEPPGETELRSDEQQPDAPVAEEVAEAVEQLLHAEQQTADAQRHKLVGKVVSSMGRNAKSVRAKGGVAGWLVGVLEEVAPRVRVRDLEALRAHHHGLTGEALADSLVRHSSRGSAVVGAAGGALAAVEYTAPPTLLSAPVQVAAETIIVSALELKLIAELHEVYGVRIEGPPRQRAVAYLQGWAAQRGVSPLQPGSVSAVLGIGARRNLRQRMLNRLGRNLTTLGPFLTGAVAGAYLNRRGTKLLADAIRNDLRGHTLDPQ